MAWARSWLHLQAHTFQEDPCGLNLAGNSRLPDTLELAFLKVPFCDLHKLSNDGVACKLPFKAKPTILLEELT